MTPIEGSAAPTIPPGHCPAPCGTCLTPGSGAAEPNVVLVHYDDLLADLEGQMRCVADRLGIAVAEQSWPALVEAATFERMRGRNDVLVRAPAGSCGQPCLLFPPRYLGCRARNSQHEETGQLPRRVAQLLRPT